LDPSKIKDAVTKNNCAPSPLNVPLTGDAKLKSISVDCDAFRDAVISITLKLAELTNIISSITLYINYKILH